MRGKRTKRAFISNKKYDSYKCWTNVELCEVFTFLVENIYYVQFEGMIFQLIVGIAIGTNCPPLIADHSFYIVMREILF